MRNRVSVWRRFGRITLWCVAAAAVVFALQLTVLAYPQPFFSEKAQVGTVTLYSDTKSPWPLDSLAWEADQRLRASCLYDSDRNVRVFLFYNEGTFRFFARLSFLRPDLQGFNLSLFGNSYINLSRIQRMAARRADAPEFSIAEGSPVHIIVHEAAHGYLADHIGRSGWKRLPLWKQEGYPEYVANISEMRKEDGATLLKRIEILNDDEIWGGRQNRARVHYEAELLWEFLLDVKGYSIEAIIADTVTREDVYNDLMAWYAQQQPSRSESDRQ